MKTSIFLFFGLIFSSFTFAQYPHWENITNTNAITTLYSDGDTLWIGTLGGLVKYNKKTKDSFCYNRANVGLSSTLILDIAKDSKNNVWIASGRYGGLGCFKAGKYTEFVDTFLTYSPYFNGIYIGNNDTMFVGAGTKFYRIYDNKTQLVGSGYTELSSLQNINDIVLAPDGSLVVAATYGLYNYKNGAYTQMNNLWARCKVVQYDNSGNLWVGTVSQGIYKYATDGLHIYNSTNSVCPNSISGCLSDKNNNVWIAGGTKLINFKETGNSEIYNIGIADDQISTVLYDDTCIWVGTSKNGLYRFSNNQFYKVGISNQGLPVIGQLNVLDSKLLTGRIQYDGKSFVALFDTLTGLKTNPLDGMKVLNNKGVFTFGDKTILGYFENGTWRYYNQFTNDIVKNIAAVSPDVFWVATTNRGLLKYDNGQVFEYNSTNSLLPNNSLYALTSDSKNVLWGSFGYSTGIPGLFSFDGTNWHIWSKTDLPSLNYSNLVMKFDSQNNLWCNSTAGLTRFDGTNWSIYDTSNSALPSNTINSIFIDKTDTVWTAGVGGGAKFDRGNKWEVYTMKNSGMLDNTTQDVIKLSNGNVYFTHNSLGISVLKNAASIKDDTPILSIQSKLIVYPIPTHDRLTVKLPVDYASYQIEIYDMAANPIYLSSWNQSNQTNDLLTINTAFFPKGVYFLQLKTDKKIYTEKVIISK